MVVSGGPIQNQPNERELNALEPAVRWMRALQTGTGRVRSFNVDTLRFHRDKAMDEVSTAKMTEYMQLLADGVSDNEQMQKAIERKIKEVFQSPSAIINCEFGFESDNQGGCELGGVRITASRSVGGFIVSSASTVTSLKGCTIRQLEHEGVLQHMKDFLKQDTARNLDALPDVARLPQVDVHSMDDPVQDVTCKVCQGTGKRGFGQSVWAPRPKASGHGDVWPAGQPAAPMPTAAFRGQKYDPRP